LFWRDPDGSRRGRQRHTHHSVTNTFSHPILWRAKPPGVGGIASPLTGAPAFCSDNNRLSQKVPSIFFPVTRKDPFVMERNHGPTPSSGEFGFSHFPSPGSSLEIDLSSAASASSSEVDGGTINWEADWIDLGGEG
jgi:hypothetical protein